VSTIRRFSKGSMQIKVAPDLYPDDVNFERAIIGDVREGGVHGFRPLVAPFLITSHQQQAKVIASPVADEALASVKPLGRDPRGPDPGEESICALK